MRYRVIPYRQGSKGAKALADALKGKVLKLQGSIWKPRPIDRIINWGNTNIPAQFASVPVLNGMDIKYATNKRNFFLQMVASGLEADVPRFWTDQTTIPDDAFPVVCRTELAGHSGAGIVIALDRSNLVSAPLYVEYVKKADEYRVHVGRRNGEGVVIAVQRKARRNDTPDEEVNWQIRNHANGFVYVRGGINPPPSVLDASRRVLIASGLDFGAVDVIWNQKKEKPFVLEINTAPGLEGQTVQDYAAFFSGLTGS